MAAGARQVARGDQALRRGLAGDAVGGEGVRRDAARGQRALAVALEVVDRGEPALGVGERATGALRAPRRHHLALRAARLRELARELREPRVALEHRDPLGAALPLRPHVERPAPEPRGVAIGVHRGQLVDRPHERVERAGSVARRQPVVGDLRVTAAALLERDGQPAVERAPAQPRHVLVDRVARERVTEGGVAAFELLDQAAGEQLLEARLAAQRGHELEVEAGPGDRRRLRGRARRIRQVAGAQQHRVADRLRQRHVGVERQVDARVTRSQPAAGRQRPGELLDEERDAPGAVVERAGQPSGRGGAEHAPGELRRPLRGERLERQLRQQVVAAQVVAEPPERVRARDLVRAVAADHEHRQFAQRAGEGRQQLERGIVGPLEVVEQHDRRPLGRDRGQPATDRLDQRRAIAGLHRVAELRQQQREMRAERTAARQPARDGAHEPAQRVDDRAVGERARTRRAAQEVGVGGPEHLLGEARLADAGLAREQDERAVALERARHRGVEPGALRVALDQGTAVHPAECKSAHRGSPGLRGRASPGAASAGGPAGRWCRTPR